MKRTATLVFCLLMFALAVPALAAPLPILNAQPEGEVRYLRQVLVRFGGDMRPLGVVEQDPATAPLRLSNLDGPVPSGVYRWVDPATLVYTFDEAIEDPVRLEALVPAGVTSLSGTVMEEEKRWSITTPPMSFHISSSGHNGEKLYPKNASFDLYTSPYVHPEELRAKMHLTLAGEPVPFELAERYPRSPDDTSPLNYGSWLVNIRRELPADADIKLAIDAGVRPLQGTLPGPAYNATLRTWSPLAVERWEGKEGPSRGEKPLPPPPVIDPEHSVFITFNNGVWGKNLREHLSISPPVPFTLLAPYQGYYDTDETIEEFEQGKSPSRQHRVRFEFKPRTVYTVTVLPGLADAMGTTLAEPALWTFTTEGLSPKLHVPGGGIMEAKLGGILPITAANTEPFDLKARFIPWEKLLAGRTPPAKDPARDMQLPAPKGIREASLPLELSKPADTLLRYELNLPELLGDIRGGVVLASAPLKTIFRSAGTGYQLTDLGITVKMAWESGLARVTGLADGKPLKGVQLRIHVEGKGEVWRGITDAAGLAVLPGEKTLPKKTSVTITAHKGKDVAAMELSSSVSFNDYRVSFTGSGNYLGVGHSRVRSSHVITQMPLYQPGQIVRYTAYLREYTDMADGKKRETGDWQAPGAGGVYSATLYDSLGQRVHEQDGLSATAYGSVSGEFALSQEAVLGWYSVIVTGPKGESYEPEAPSFQVASFRAPDFKVDVKTPEVSIVPPQGEKTPSATVSGVYFSGAPLSGAKVEFSTRGRTYGFAPENLDGYAVGTSGTTRPENMYPEPDWTGHLYYRYFSQSRRWYTRDSHFSLFLRREGVLDKNGKADFILEELKSAPGQPYLYVLEPTVTDASGLTTQGKGSFVLHPSAAYVGIKIPAVVAEHDRIRLEVKGATFDGKPLVGTTVELELTNARAQPTIKDKNERRTPEKNSVAASPLQDEAVWRTTHTLTNAGGDPLTFAAPKSGYYILTAKIKDDKGRENITRKYIHVAGPNMAWKAFAYTRWNRQSLEIVADKEEYSPGDTARLVLKNFQAVGDEPFEALITTEREGVREVRTQTVRGAAPVVEIPLTEKDRPYVFVSVVLTRGRIAPPPRLEDKPGRDDGAPRVLQGLICLKLPPKENPPRVTVTADAASYLPGGEVTVNVASFDGQGKGKKAEITLLAVDSRIIRAAGETSYANPAASFSPLYPHGVETMDIRTRLIDLDNPLFPGPWLQANYSISEPQGPDQTPLSADLPDALPRKDFRPDVFWLAQAETDNQGRLSRSFSLPDSLTEYRIVAVAAGRGTDFAVAETPIVARQPLQLLSALPRFVTEGDTLQARVLVQNLGDTGGTVEVTAELEDAGQPLELTGERMKTVAVRAGDGVPVSFPLRANAFGKGELLFRAVSRDAGGKETGRDAVSLSLPVEAAAPLTTVAAAGLLRAGERHILPVQPPAPLDARSRLDVVFASSPAAGLPLTAQALLDYPWHCLEQRLSRAWMRAIRVQYGDLVGLPADAGDIQKIAEVWKSVPRFQDEQGGFSLWGKGGEPDFHLTAYVLLVDGWMRRMSRLEEVGAGLSYDEAARAVSWLERQLDDRVRESDESRHGLTSADSPDSQALAVLALSMSEHYGAMDAAYTHLPLVWKRMRENGGGNPFGISALLMAVGELEKHERERLESEAESDTHTDAKTNSDEKEYAQLTREAAALKAELLAALQKTASVTPTQLHFAERNWEWSLFAMGSSLRDNGMVLLALSRTQLGYPRLEALASWISQGLGEKEILSTQEAIFGLVGLTAYLEGLGGNQPVTLKATWNGKESLAHSFSRLTEPPQTWSLPAASLNGGEKNELALEAVQGNPHWTARLRYASPSLPAQPESAGFMLSRTLDRPGPYRMGDEVEVTLTLDVPASRQHVLVFSPFPAGLEPLHVTRIDLQEKEEQKDCPYPWERCEMRRTGVLLYASQLSPGTYQYRYKLRAATAGNFVQRPARVEEMYTPEVYGTTGGGLVKVEE